MKKYFKNNNIPVIRILDSYSIIKPSDKDYASFLTIYEWCETTYKELSAIDKTTTPVSRYISRKNKVQQPHAMIREDIMIKETEEWNNYLKVMTENNKDR